MVTLNNLWSSLIFWVITINIIAFIVVLATELMPNLKRQLLKIPRLLQQAFVFLIWVPPCVLPLLSQPRFTLLSGWIALPIGAIFVLGATIIEILAFRQIGIIPSLIPKEKKGNLLTTGIYGVVRHPIYSGVIFLALGLALTFRGIYSLIYVPVIAVLYTIMTALEEKELVEDYGEEYIEYKRKVHWRIIPRVF